MITIVLNTSNSVIEVSIFLNENMLNFANKKNYLLDSHSQLIPGYHQKLSSSYSSVRSRSTVILIEQNAFGSAPQKKKQRNWYDIYEWLWCNINRRLLFIVYLQFIAYAFLLSTNIYVCFATAVRWRHGGELLFENTLLCRPLRDGFLTHIVIVAVVVDVVGKAICLFVDFPSCKAQTNTEK